MLLEFILFLERPILFCLMDIYIWGSWPPGKRIKNSAFDSTDWKSCMRTLWNSLNLDLRVIDGFDEQLGSNYQLNATIQYPFGKLGKPTSLAKLLQQNIKFKINFEHKILGKPTSLAKLLQQIIKVEINSEQKNGMALNWHHHKIKHICYVVRAYLTTKPKLSINLISSKCKNVGDHINMKWAKWKQRSRDKTLQSTVKEKAQKTGILNDNS